MFYRAEEIKQQMDEQNIGKNQCLSIEARKLQHINWWTCAEDVTRFLLIFEASHHFYVCETAEVPGSYLL